MAKKKVLVLVLAVLAAGGVFAQEKFLSFGGGGVFTPGFGSFEPGEGKTSFLGGGVNLFFDAKYAELNVNLIFASVKQSEDQDPAPFTTNLVIGLVGKYPFTLSEKLTLFPFAGIDYNIGLAASLDGEDLKDVWDPMGDYMNYLSIVFGVGVDFNITEALYLRGEVGFGIGFATKNESDAEYDSLFKGKIPIKIAVGYRL